MKMKTPPTAFSLFSKVSRQKWDKTLLRAFTGVVAGVFWMDGRLGARFHGQIFVDLAAKTVIAQKCRIFREAEQLRMHPNCGLKR
ncbi:hypothetical protein [Rhizobium sp. L1K21]|uniref:hypothetical protein n=1 Tax=Rhizobium sp. L1K21 TaxID=2954933 RepID=UPI002092B1A6|nr:hypothetical protein [Rhizobium sp. L1K21]MCO6186844.1 hypothetical protein [Rhizobium sp. L1K21]